jgi:methyl-accepting chemotaxis protein
VTFSIVAKETADMAQHAAASSKTIRQLIETVATNIDKASVELQDRAATDNRDALASRAEVNKMLDSIAALHEEMQRTISASKANSESLARDISKAVVTLQFQDTVGQRIAHVIHALKGMHASFQRCMENPEASQVAEGTPPAAGNDWKEGMSQQYTMESERRVLAACTGKDVVQSDNDSNVELF